MTVELRQRGRAAMDFMIDLTIASRPLAARWNADLAAAGVTAATLPDDLDDRHTHVDAALADSRAYGTSGLIMEFASVEHGRVAREAFDEIADVTLPRLAALAEGHATLTADPDFEAPDYFKGVWFHRTTGGWDGHPHMGFIHSELIHKTYVARNFGGDIFAQRRAVLGTLPRTDFRRILEMGTSSGHYTTALAETFPDAHITGVDLSLPMLEEARRVANAHGWAWDLHQAAGEATGFAPASFDLVTSYIIFHEMPAAAIRAAFHEAFRLLEPGGQVLMSDVTPYAAQDKLGVWRADAMAKRGGEPYWREAASFDWAEAARDAGFVDVTAGGLNGLPYPHVVCGTKPEAH